MHGLGGLDLLPTCNVTHSLGDERKDLLLMEENRGRQLELRGHHLSPTSSIRSWPTASRSKRGSPARRNRRQRCRRRWRRLGITYACKHFTRCGTISARAATAARYRRPFEPKRTASGIRKISALASGSGSRRIGPQARPPRHRCPGAIAPDRSNAVFLMPST